MAKILIVEDDQFLMKMYKKKFEVAGYTLEVAGDGEEGIEKMKSFKPDLVFMDIMMPKLNGLDALDKIKADESIKNIPIVMLTNLSSTADAETALKKGALKYFVKSDLVPSDIVQKAKEIVGS